MKVNWDHIKEVWEEGIEDLNKVAARYHLSLPEISIQAKTRGWADRDSAKPLIGEFAEPILNDLQVTLAHKSDMGNLRLVAATVMETLAYEVDRDALLKAAERLAKIYAIIIPMERKIFGIELGSDGSPDGITININKKGKKK